MDDLKFDIYAMVKPKTKEDYIALLDEAILELGHIQENLNRAYEAALKEQERRGRKGGAA